MHLTVSSSNTLRLLYIEWSSGSSARETKIKQREITLPTLNEGMDVLRVAKFPADNNGNTNIPDVVPLVNVWEVLLCSATRRCELCWVLEHELRDICLLAAFIERCHEILDHRREHSICVNVECNKRSP